MRVNGARNPKLLFAIMVKERVAWRVDGSTTISADQFAVYPSDGVNGSINAELLVAIRVKKGVVWRFDGLAAISVGSTICRTHHPDPNRGKALSVRRFLGWRAKKKNAHYSARPIGRSGDVFLAGAFPNTGQKKRAI